MGRKKAKRVEARPAVGMRPVERSAFDRVDPEHVPHVDHGAPAPIVAPERPRPRVRLQPGEEERRIHGIWMVILGPVMFLLMRMIAGQNAEAKGKIAHVRATFRPTVCTIEGVQTMSGNKTGRRANYEYTYVVDGKGFRAFGYAPDGPKPGTSDQQLRDAYPLKRRVDCIYDPSSPSTAYLTSSPTTPSFDPTLFMWLAAGMTLVGLGLLLHGPVTRRLARR